MVLTIANLWLKDQGCGNWTPALRLRYRQEIRDPALRERLKKRVKKRVLPLQSILKELDKRKETYVLIRINKNDKPQYSVSPDIPTDEAFAKTLSEKCGELSKAIVKKQEGIANAKEIAEATIEPIVNFGFDEFIQKGVGFMRKKLSEMAKTAFEKAGFTTQIPWSLIVSDQNNTGQQKGPGIFQPKLCSPHNLNLDQCVAAFTEIAECGGEVKFWSHAEFLAANPNPDLDNNSIDVALNELPNAVTNDQSGNQDESDFGVPDEEHGDSDEEMPQGTNQAEPIIPQISLFARASSNNDNNVSITDERCTERPSANHDLLLQACQESGINLQPGGYTYQQNPQQFSSPAFLGVQAQSLPMLQNYQFPIYPAAVLQNQVTYALPSSDAGFMPQLVPSTVQGQPHRLSVFIEEVQSDENDL